MKCLNDCLASYLEGVRNLEVDNQRLESKIQEHLEKKNSQVRDCGHYFKTMEDMRAQILQVLCTMPTLFCRLTMPVLLLMTAESSMTWS